MHMARNSWQRSLPQLDSAQIQDLRWEHPDCHAAYNRVLGAEERALQLLTKANTIQGSEGSIGAKGELVAARVAGYVLLELSSQSSIVGVQPSTELVKWLTPKPQQDQYDVVIGTGTLLREKLIRPFRTSHTRYQPPSSLPSRPEFDTLQEQFNATMRSTDKDHRTRKGKVLAREGYRCVVTGILDEASLQRISELDEKYHTFIATRLEAAHIFNFDESMVHIGSPVEEDTHDTLSPGKRDTAGGALSILKLLGFSSADVFAIEEGIHDPRNTIILDHHIHVYFDTLQLWFEPTDKLHRYKVCALPRQQEYIRRNFVGEDRNIIGAPEFVEFNAQIKEVPPPDPSLLALHGICARVAHMSGAKELFDKIEDDAEETRVLVPDGSSASLLSLLLSSHASVWLQ